MKKRGLSLLLAAMALLSLCVPVLADAPADTPAPTLEPVETPGETVVPTLEPTETPEETAVPTLEPTEVPEETSSPTQEPEETPGETIVPTQEPEETTGEIVDPTLEPEVTLEESASPTLDPETSPDPEGEIMLLSAEPGLTMNMTEVTMKSERRPITLRADMAQYVYETRKISWESSDPDVVSVEWLRDPNTVTRYGEAKIWAKKAGTATITATAYQTAEQWTATCTVTVVQDGTTTWGMTLGDVKAMADPATQLDIYDPRDLNIMTPVNLQIGGICGMEGNIAAMEASIVKQGFLDTQQADIAERHLVSHLFSHAKDPVGYSNADASKNYNWNYEAVRIHAAATFMTQWDGPIHDDGSYGLEEKDGYANCIAVPEDVVFVGGEVEALKRIVAQYGGIAIGYESSSEGALYHKHSTNGAGWHCSAIVGWDDTVSKDLFLNSDPMSRAQHDGVDREKLLGSE